MSVSESVSVRRGVSVSVRRGVGLACLCGIVVWCDLCYNGVVW